MTLELDKVFSKIGLNINFDKTTVMTNRILKNKIKVKNQELEAVDGYVCLGHKINLHRENQTVEVYRRRNLAWGAFGKLKNALKNEKCQ